MASLTTVAAFGTLCFSGFPVFVQLGQFTMLGAGLSFLIVHLVFPRIFPSLPPGGERSPHLQKVVDALGGTGRTGFWAAALFAVAILPFARPVFDVSLQAMNTVGAATRAAETLLTDVWGGMFDKAYVLTEGPSIEALQAQGDALVARIDADLRAGALSAGFVPSMIAPGTELRQRNFAAWREFWNPDRVEALKRALGTAAAAAGFAEDAFAPFYAMAGAASPPAADARILERFPGFMGISRSPEGSAWIQVSTLTTGPGYDPRRFYGDYRASAKVFDPLYFSERIGALLFDTAALFFLINLASSFVIVAVFILDGALTLATLLPSIWAMIATLGTLNLMGRPLDIPGLMLSIIVFGLGIDFSIFYVRSFQRYGTLDHPAFSLIRMAIFLSAVATLFGFGAMWGANHSLLRSTGITAFLGIAYSMLGSFLILPALLERIGRRRLNRLAPGSNLCARGWARYRHMEAYPRLFARFKMRLDPMFAELEEILRSVEGVKAILDVGTGYGVPASWLLERFPDAQVRGVEPSADLRIGEPFQQPGGRHPVAGADIRNRLHALHGAQDLFQFARTGSRCLKAREKPRVGLHVAVARHPRAHRLDPGARRFKRRRPDASGGAGRSGTIRASSTRCRKATVIPVLRRSEWLAPHMAPNPNRVATAERKMAMRIRLKAGWSRVP